MVVYLPALGELTAIKQLGNMTPEELTKVWVIIGSHWCHSVCDALQGVDLCVEGSVRIHQRVKEFLKKNAKHKHDLLKTNK